MPCNSDYLEPNQREAELQRAAKLLLFCYREHGVKGVTRDLIAAAADCYCRKDFVADLCEFLTDFQAKSKPNFERFIYNGKRAECRDLANWWQEHERADRARETQEALERENKRLRKSALVKLSLAEKKALGIIS